LNSDGGWADLDLFNFSITMDNNCFPIFVGTRSWSGNVYHGNSLVLQYLAFDPTYSVGNQVLNWMYGLSEVAKLPPVSTIPHTRDDFIRVIGWIERIGRSIWRTLMPTKIGLPSYATHQSTNSGWDIRFPTWNKWMWTTMRNLDLDGTKMWQDLKSNSYICTMHFMEIQGHGERVSGLQWHIRFVCTRGIEWFHEFWYGVNYAVSDIVLCWVLKEHKRSFGTSTMRDVTKVVLQDWTIELLW
jgi:hypothetical protein